MRGHTIENGMLALLVFYAIVDQNVEEMEGFGPSMAESKSAALDQTRRHLHKIYGASSE